MCLNKECTRFRAGENYGVVEQALPKQEHDSRKYYLTWITDYASHVIKANIAQSTFCQSQGRQILESSADAENLQSNGAELHHDSCWIATITSKINDKQRCFRGQRCLCTNCKWQKADI
jgi:hypothetical protein